MWILSGVGHSQKESFQEVKSRLGTLESGSYHILKVNKEKGGFDNGVTPKGVMIYNGKEAPKKRKRKSDAPPAGSESRKSKN